MYYQFNQTNNKMDINDFKEQAEDLISQFEDLIEEMPQRSDKTSGCQKMTLQQAINELSYAVNGTEQEDFEDLSECCEAPIRHAVIDINGTDLDPDGTECSKCGEEYPNKL